MSFPILLTFSEGFSGGGLQKLEYLYLQESLTESLIIFAGKPNGSPDRYLQESLTEALTDICRKA